jgi:hypothetical protein
MLIDTLSGYNNTLTCRHSSNEKRLHLPDHGLHHSLTWCCYRCIFGLSALFHCMQPGEWLIQDS